jgi:hypothetical protein
MGDFNVGVRWDLGLFAARSAMAHRHLWRFAAAGLCLVVLAGDCHKHPPPPPPRVPFTKGILGVWVIDTERSLRDMSVISGSDRFRSLDALRDYVRPQIEGGEFEIFAGGKAIFRNKARGRDDMIWEKSGEKYWVGNHFFLSASVGHIFVLQDDRTAICKFQFDYSEDQAPRTQLYVTKVRE